MMWKCVFLVAVGPQGVQSKWRKYVVRDRRLLLKSGSRSPPRTLSRTLGHQQRRFEQVGKVARFAEIERESETEGTRWVL